MTVDSAAPTGDLWSSAAVHDGTELLLTIPDPAGEPFCEPRSGGLTTLVVEFSEAMDLGLAYPEILRSIEEDQDRLGLAKKQLRAECSDWRLRQTLALPGMYGEPRSPPVVLPLLGGRPRMVAETVLTFLVMWHHFQSVYTQEGGRGLWIH